MSTEYRNIGTDLYIISDEAVEIETSKVTPEIEFIWVQLELMDGFKTLNAGYADMLKPINYKMLTVQRPPWAGPVDEITVDGLTYTLDEPEEQEGYVIVTKEYEGYTYYASIVESITQDGLTYYYEAPAEESGYTQVTITSYGYTYTANLPESITQDGLTYYYETPAQEAGYTQVTLTSYGYTYTANLPETVVVDGTTYYLTQPASPGENYELRTTEQYGYTYYAWVYVEPVVQEQWDYIGGTDPAYNQIDDLNTLVGQEAQDIGSETGTYPWWDMSTDIYSGIGEYIDIMIGDGARPTDYEWNALTQFIDANNMSAQSDPNMHTSLQMPIDMYVVGKDDPSVGTIASAYGDITYYDTTHALTLTTTSASIVVNNETITAQCYNYTNSDAGFGIKFYIKETVTEVEDMMNMDPDNPTMIDQYQWELVEGATSGADYTGTTVGSKYRLFMGSPSIPM